MENQESSDETVYTLVPDVFVLPEMIQNPKPFSAQIFKGHFERGRTLIADNVTVNIKKVIYFKKFSPAEVKPVPEVIFYLAISPSSFWLIRSRQRLAQWLSKSIKAFIWNTGISRIREGPGLAISLTRQ